MKWGYKYENHDIVLNQKAEGSDLSTQAIAIWCSQERGEYYSNFGFDRNFFTTKEDNLFQEIIKKLNSDIYIPQNTNASFELEKLKLEELKINIIFK